MAGGYGSPVEKIRTLSRTELLLHKVAMKRMQQRHGQQSAERKASGIYCDREFALEDHKLKNKVHQLEKEKRQCIHRHKENAHMFRMSVKLPPQCGKEYWPQYGEKFHANGDFRENCYLLRLPPQPSPRQQSRTQKERHGSTDMSMNNQPPCKTVSDLISLMREVTPLEANETADFCPLSSSSMVRRFSKQNLEDAKTESLQKLKVLLENYEMFVPNEGDMELNRELSNESKSKKNYKETRSKSVDDIKKVELRVSKERSQSAQSNQETKGKKPFRKRNSAPVRDIAHGVLRVYALQPSCSKFDKLEIQNYSLKESSGAFLKSPRRVGERTEFYCSHESDREPNTSFDEGRTQLSTEGAVKQNNTKANRLEPSLKERPVDKKHEFPEHLENSREDTERNPKSSLKEEENDLFNETKALKTESFDNISYYFTDNIESYNSTETHHLGRKTPARITTRCEREATATLRSSRGIRSPSTPSGGFLPGKVSIQNITPDLPLDFKALRGSPKKNTVGVNNQLRKQQGYWGPKPKSAMSVRKKLSISAASDVINVQPDHLVHASFKGRKSTIMVLGKGLIDIKNQQRKTREKMDQFFARLDSTNNGEASELHAAAPTRPNTATLISRERRLKKQEYQRKTEKKYKRAAPWPVQVWC